jgi:hypothetical protein
MAYYADTRADATNTIEKGSDGDINYLVVRQTASNKGGYETKPADINRLLDLSIEIANEMKNQKPGRRGGPQPPPFPVM